MNYACVHCRVGIRVIWRIETQFCTIFDISYAQQHPCGIYPSLMSFTFSLCPLISRFHLHCWVSSIFITYLLFNQFHPLDEVQPHDPISVVDCGKFHLCHQGHLNVFVHPCIQLCLNHELIPPMSFSFIHTVVLLNVIHFIPCERNFIPFNFIENNQFHQTSSMW